MTAPDPRALRVPGDPLVLPNAWDAATALVGFPAAATTSSGVAEALGYEVRASRPSGCRRPCVNRRGRRS